MRTIVCGIAGNYDEFIIGPKWHGKFNNSFSSVNNKPQNKKFTETMPLISHKIQDTFTKTNGK